jgi:hypothetical protein
MIWAAVILGSLGAMAFKFAGFALPRRLIEKPRVVAVALLYPVALLAALVAVQTFSSLGQLSLDWRALGVGAGVIALLLRAPFVVVVLVAALVTAGARYLFG